MGKVLVEESNLSSIANAIRTKADIYTLFKPSEMAGAIADIPAGITPIGTKNITQNGTVDVTQYASAAVSVPNSYSASDEGKVVSNGALVSQGSQTITQNGTYDTTTVSELTVNISGGGSGTENYYLIDPNEIDVYQATNYQEGGLPCSCVMARYGSAPFFVVGASSFDGSTVGCVQRAYTDVCGLIFTKKILAGKYTKLCAKVKIESSGYSNQMSTICLLPDCEFANADGWMGGTAYYLTDSSKTVSEINNQVGIVINTSDNKNLSEQTIEITLPSSDCYIGILSWFCTMSIREMYLVGATE